MDETDWQPEVLNVERSEHSALEFYEWHQAGNKLILSPDFQRADVWTQPMKAYLIDTLLSGFPVPPLHIRQENIAGKGIVREVIDGQQRLTALIQYMENRFALPNPNDPVGDVPPWAGSRFSGLDPDLQRRIENYRFRCEIYNGDVSDRTIHEIFARINLHSIALNDQELRNGRYFGEFKQSVYRLAREHAPFWTATGIFSKRAVARMLDAQFVSEALIAQASGLQDKKGMLDSYYKDHDEVWPDRQEQERKFRGVIDAIRGSCGDALPTTAFTRPPLFYSLFTATYHRLYGLPVGRAVPGPLPNTPMAALTEHASERLRTAVLTLSRGLSEEKSQAGPWRDFAAASARQTDNIRPRYVRFMAVWEEANLSGV